MTRCFAKIPAVVLVATLAAPLYAEGPVKDGDTPGHGGPKEFAGLKYRLIGPPAGGRVSRVAGVPGDPRIYFAATASGGVWKSSDGGIHWKSVFDDQRNSSTGSVAVSPSQPNVVYVGGGEANIRGNVAQGSGIFKSVDGGATWSHVWKQEGQIGTMVVHPKNPDVAYAAVLGKPFGPNPERGVYRTRDGGRSWQRVLAKDADTGASDVALDPNNPEVLFAGLWQARRRPWEMTSGGKGSGLHVSRDGGDTWKQLQEKGLPEGIWGKVGVGVAPSDSRRVYALIEAEKGGLYRSDDGGQTWSLVNGHRALRQRAWYYTTLTIDPKNADIVWFPQVPMLKTVDGGKTLKQVKGIHHGDHHDVWIDPVDPRRMITANDGGVDVSSDGGETWYAPPLPLSQFYHVTTDNSVPYRVSGALQDLGTASGPSNSLSSAGIMLSDWHGVGGGEAGHVAHDWEDPNVVYAGEYLGIFSRYDHRTRESRHVGAYPNNLSGHGAADFKYRFQWTAPIVVSPHDAKTVYHGGNVLFRTQDGGQTWTAISPDLTRNDKTKQQWSGGPITGDNTGVEHYDTIFALAESTREKGLLWVGSDDGLVHVSRDAGKTWSNVTPNVPGIPHWGTVALIEASPHDAATAYLVVDNHRMDDARPYLWKTSDYGRTWKNLAASLPQDVYLHAVREDPRRRGLLFLGTERGVSYSLDDGARFSPLRLNLPTVPVHDLVVKDDDLVVGTHGRSAWILDDIAPIREWTPAVAGKPAHLFSVSPAVSWNRFSPVSGQMSGPGENPARGALFQYWLKEKPKGEAVLEIVDPKGAVARRYTSTKQEPEVPEDDPDGSEETKGTTLSLDPGVQRMAWSLEYEGAQRISKAKVDTGDPKYGPRALPGTYTARLTVDGQLHTQPFEVKADPRARIVKAEHEEQLAFALRLRDDVSRLTGIVHELRSVRQQIQARHELLKGQVPAEALLKDGEAIVEKADALEARLHNPKAEIVYDILAQKGGTKLYSQLIALYMYALDGTRPPTQGMRELEADYSRELLALEAEWNALRDGEVAALNAKAREAGISHVVVGRK